MQPRCNVFSKPALRLCCRGRNVALDCAKGLNYLHSNKLVHFDLVRPCPALLAYRAEPPYTAGGLFQLHDTTLGPSPDHRSHIDVQTDHCDSDFCPCRSPATSCSQKPAMPRLVSALICYSSPVCTLKLPVTTRSTLVTGTYWLCCLLLSSTLALIVHCRIVCAPDTQHRPAAGDVGFAKVLDMTHLSQISGRGTFAWAAPEVGWQICVDIEWLTHTAAL